jgi:GTP cyclohydrolase-4
MGNRQWNVDKALELLSERLQIGKVSSIYETEPVDNIEQPRFFNLVCQVSTVVTPEALLNLAKGIEFKLGRTGKPNSPRPIDIDILFYGDQVIKTKELEIPHPRLTERAFVLVPLAEIAPKLVHPVNGKTVKKLLKAITEKQGVFKWGNNKGE